MKKTIKPKKAKKVELPEGFEVTQMTGFAQVVPEITLLPVDFGREDLNLIAQKVNELILLRK